MESSVSTEVVLISIDGSMEVFEKKKERGRKRERKKERDKERLGAILVDHLNWCYFYKTY